MRCAVMFARAALSPLRFASGMLVGLLCTLALVACTPQGAKFNAIDITGADYARDFQLTDHNGQTRTLQDFRGKVVVLFFGYTQCPDVCPTTMAELVEVRTLLGAEGAKVQGLFVSLDPERDTTEVLKTYMGNFDPGFLALRPTLEELPALAKNFKVYYKKSESKGGAGYTLDHTAASYVYDPQGRLRLYVRYGSGAQTLASDLRQLLK